MNYSALKKTAENLLRQFGNAKTCYLYRKERNSVSVYKGVGVKSNYDSEAIGLNGNVIKAGDAKIICQFEVMPTESIDIIEMEGEKFSIVNSGDISPDNKTKLLYKLQVRKN